MTKTDASSAQDFALAERTVWLWRHRFSQHRLDGLKDRPKCPPPRQYHADIQARLLVLACQKPAEVDPTRAGQTHWSINDLAQYVAAHPELGLGSPSKSTIGVILKHITDDPQRPTAINPQVDPRLEAICLKAMRKRKEDRYATAREMRADLRAVRDQARGRTEDTGRIVLGSSPSAT